MRTIGMIVGMSWESSAIYYRILNEAVKERLGGHHSAQTVLYSGTSPRSSTSTTRAGGRRRQRPSRRRPVRSNGADYAVLYTNTMHRMADAITEAVSIPLVHIAEATAEEIEAQGIRRVGLLATGFTMEQDFYKGRLAREHRLEVLVPDEEERRTVHDVIYDELCLGEVKESSGEEYRRIVSGLVERGVEAVILGGTEITMLVGQEDASVPLFDTTAIHAEKAVEVAVAPLAHDKPKIVP